MLCNGVTGNANEVGAAQSRNTISIGVYGKVAE